jgi:hypothetical protein
MELLSRDVCDSSQEIFVISLEGLVLFLSFFPNCLDKSLQPVNKDKWAIHKDKVV